MSYEVRFGKDRYHQQREMEVWCLECIGNGGWSYSTPKTWDGMAGNLWVMHSMFGHTTFAFKNEADASMFILKWEWQNVEL